MSTNDTYTEKRLHIMARDVAVEYGHKFGAKHNTIWRVELPGITVLYNTLRDFVHVSCNNQTVFESSRGRASIFLTSDNWQAQLSEFYNNAQQQTEDLLKTYGSSNQ